MSDYGRMNSRDLDRHITGNYGEDQLRGDPLVELPSCVNFETFERIMAGDLRFLNAEQMAHAVYILGMDW